MNLQFSAKTKSNHNRNHNKDFFMSGEELWNDLLGYLFVVCQGSDLKTSQFVCETIISEFYADKSKNRLKVAENSIRKTNILLVGSKEYKRAETIVALFQNANLSILHVGNCRASHFSRGKISHDLGRVTLVEKLISEGHLTIEEAKGVPYIAPTGLSPWNLGIEKDIKLELISKPILSADVVLLSTISSWESFVLNNELVSILQENSLEKICTDILAPNKNEGQDSDATIMVIRT